MGRGAYAAPSMDSDAYGSLFDLNGRTAIITGGTRGIGRSSF